MVGQYIDIYRVTQKLGQGGMGQVWKAIDTQLDRTVALKVMNVQDPMFLQRFRAEAKALAMLDHPNIVRVFGMRETPIGMVIIMEFVEGKDWSDLISQGKYNTPEDVANISSQLLSALEYAHSKAIIHRDIKPSNIMIMADGTVKVTDFGLAKLIDPQATIAGNPLTQAGQAVGSLYYMSPEQVKGLDSVDQRTDIYSTGITMYEALAGRPPFEDVTATSPYVIQKKIVDGDVPAITSAAPGIPADLAKVINRAIQVRPDRRYSSAADMRLGLQQLATGKQSSSVPPASSSKKTVLPPKSVTTRPTNPNWIMFGGIAAVVVLGFVAVWFFVLKPQPKPGPQPQQNITQNDPLPNSNTSLQPSQIDNPTVPHVNNTPASTNNTSDTPVLTTPPPKNNTPARDRIQQGVQTIRENVQNREPIITRPTQPQTKPNNVNNNSQTTPPVTEKPKEDPKPEPPAAEGSFMVTVVGPNGEPLPATISTDLGSGYGARKRFTGKPGVYSVSVKGPDGTTKNTSVKVVAGTTTPVTVRF
ncbi:MAG: protein kinase [Bacteroidetes Order II. Incertae sedis bacterium]|nr:protein kinase [Bacteroidetes Order II. bacterium]